MWFGNNSPRDWAENETKEFLEAVTAMKKRLLKFFLKISPFPSSALELLRSRQLQQLFLSLIATINYETAFTGLDHQTIVCTMLNALANEKFAKLKDIYQFIHEKTHIKTLLNVLSTHTRESYVFSFVLLCTFCTPHTKN